MPEPQRIVILNNQGLRAIGGGPTIMRALVRRLRPRHQVAVLSYDAPAPDAGVEQVQLASPPTAGSVVWRVQALLRAWFLRRTVPARFGPPADLLIVDRKSVV